jgi:large conductance mechanosensitive channel
MKGFKNFLMQGELVVIAVGLVVALGFSTLIKSFTDSIITPLVNAAGGGKAGSVGLGWTINGQRIDVGTFIGAIVYFLIFMAVIYMAPVLPPTPRPVPNVFRTTCPRLPSNAATARA